MVVGNEVFPERGIAIKGTGETRDESFLKQSFSRDVPPTVNNRQTYNITTRASFFLSEAYQRRSLTVWTVWTGNLLSRPSARVSRWAVFIRDLWIKEFFSDGDRRRRRSNNIQSHSSETVMQYIISFRSTDSMRLGSRLTGCCCPVTSSRPFDPVQCRLLDTVGAGSVAGVWVYIGYLLRGVVWYNGRRRGDTRVFRGFSKKKHDCEPSFFYTPRYTVSSAAIECSENQIKRSQRVMTHTQSRLYYFSQTINNLTENHRLEWFYIIIFGTPSSRVRIPRLYYFFIYSNISKWK